MHWDGGGRRRPIDGRGRTEVKKLPIYLESRDAGGRAVRQKGREDEREREI